MYDRNKWEWKIGAISFLRRNSSSQKSEFRSREIFQLGGHFGVRASLERAIRYIYYPGLRKDFQNRIAQCGKCLAKERKTDIHQTVHKPKVASFPFERLYVDLVGPLGDGQSGPRYILTVEDHFTRWVTAVPIPIYGCPEEIHSDQGKEFTSKLWVELMDNLQINLTMTPTYNPQSNLVERFH